MQPLFSQQPVFFWTFLISVIIWRVMETFVDIRSRQSFRTNPRRQDNGSFITLITLILLSLLFGTLIAFNVPATTITVARFFLFWLGILLLNGGIVLRWYAINTLGAYFTTKVAIAPNQTLIETGPYRLIRHPSYTGLMLTLLGYSLCLTNWVSSLVIVGCALLGLSYRIRVEERVLMAQLGQPYREYMRHTKRLIPFVL
ncbi:MAG: isoprenylcysteine carboxylmethyltransferase family protein [Ktedonobacteraceae bacterium]|nr:isoprenylcysteine carboxylmethyltransferase family protein [Ktedonobacteraceae bacterium]